MNEDSYPFTAVEGQFVYRFESVGANKKIQKAVLFTRTESLNVFNLALVDLDDDEQMRDDVESKNGDMATVLATVFKIVEDFLKVKPDYIVMFRGTTTGGKGFTE